MNRLKRFAEWSDTGEAGLMALVIMIATLGIVGSAGMLSWAASIYGVGMFWLLHKISEDKKRLKRHKDLTKIK